MRLLKNTGWNLIRKRYGKLIKFILKGFSYNDNMLYNSVFRAAETPGDNFAEVFFISFEDCFNPAIGKIFYPSCYIVLQRDFLCVRSERYSLNLSFYKNMYALLCHIQKRNSFF